MTRARTRTRRPAAAALILTATLTAACTPTSQRTPSPTPPVLAPSWSVASPGVSGTGSASGAPGSPGATTSPGTSGAPPAASAVRQLPPGPGGGQTRATTPQGVWLVSGSGELVLFDPAGTRILRRYPFAGVPPQWLLVTPAAVFCGRAGTTDLPDAMVCRIDRTTGELRVRVLADRRAEPDTNAQDVAGRPGRWVIDARNPGVDLGRPPRQRPTELVFVGPGGRQFLLDPDTLQVLGS